MFASDLNLHILQYLSAKIQALSRYLKSKLNTGSQFIRPLKTRSIKVMMITLFPRQKRNLKVSPAKGKQKRKPL
ncbi:hypothetical protein AL542_18410 [Grimontia hollisae]|nr:hypothetical protein AL542_18410 [Grimontia hollisae]